MKDRQPKHFAHDEDEWLDVVDEKDLVIGRRLRSESHREHASNYRVVNAFVRNSQGQIWVPVRASHLDLYPNALDFSIAGHVSSGEPYDIAFEREAREELDIDINKTGYQLLGKLTPSQDQVAVFMKVYEIITDETPKINLTEFSSGSWRYPFEILRDISQGVQAKSDLPIVLKRFYR